MKRIILIFVIFMIIGNCTYLNQKCSDQPCLPNGNYLNRGINIVTNLPVGDALGLVWSNDSYYQNPNTGQWYQIPYGVTVNSLSKTTDHEYYGIFKTVDDASKWQSYSSTGSYKFGMCSKSSMTNQSIISIYQQIRNIAHIVKKQKNYYVSIPPSQMALSSECQKNIDLLPLEYNRDMYRQFILAFGTHVSNYSEWGIEYNFRSSIKECYVKNTESSYTETQVRTHGWIKSERHTTYTGYTKTDEYYSSRSIVSETFKGGNINYHSSAMWDAWWQSGTDMVDPVMVHYTLTELYHFIKDKVKQNNMIRAYNEYLQESYDQQNQIILNSKLAAHDVTYALFQTGSGGVEYLVRPTTTTLSAGQNSPIIGTDGSCNHLHLGSYTVSGGGRQYPRYVMYPDLHYCKRFSDGTLQAKTYFDAENWSNNTNVDDDCSRTSVNVTSSNFPTQSKTFSWQLFRGKYRSVEMNKPFDWFAHPHPYNATTIYNISYSTNDQLTNSWMSNSVEATDGQNVTTYDRSISKGFMKWFVCYFDCDSISVTVGSGGNPDVTCVC